MMKMITKFTQEMYRLQKMLSIVLFHYFIKCCLDFQITIRIYCNTYTEYVDFTLK